MRPASGRHRPLTQLPYVRFLVGLHASQATLPARSFRAAENGAVGCLDGGSGTYDESRSVCGGALGIRTLDTIAGIPHFECGAFDHSANAPHRRGSI
ncbi:hypothetical protein SPHINGOR109_10522 [Sphingorhabdus sp. 109]|nr:hypothetical protein SPHINGOR109_10522 [Sphingorhabdus sp. 109]